jgi:hypothetical protein
LSNCEGKELRPLFLGLWLLVLAGCGVAGPQSAIHNAQESGVINFAGAGLRLVYPVEWKETDILPEHAILVLRRGEQTLSFIVQPVNDPDVNAMERRAVEKYRTQFDNFELIESSSAHLGDLPARRIVFRARTRHGDDFEMMSTLAAYHGQGYAAIYTASPETFESGRADAQRIIDSVQFTK